MCLHPLHVEILKKRKKVINAVIKLKWLNADLSSRQQITIFDVQWDRKFCYQFFQVVDTF